VASLYDIPLLSIDGRECTLAEYRGRVLLIVNTASRCGFTPQYAELQALYERLAPRGLVVLGFPCDQFAHQEPGSEAEIASFCSRNYGVTFPMFAKLEVNGAGEHPLYRLLKQARPGLFGTRRIKWNFTKFAVDRSGHVVARYAPRTPPARLAGALELLTGQR